MIEAKAIGDISMFRIPIVAEYVVSDKFKILELLGDIYDKEDIEFLTLAHKRLIEKSIRPLLLCEPNELKTRYLEYYQKGLPYLLLFAPTDDYKKILDVITDLYERIEIPDELFEAFEIICETEVWYLSKISEMGLEEFIHTIMDRASEEFNWLVSYYLHSVYLFLACYSAKKDLIDYKRETLNVLTLWLKSYTDELDAYLSTVDLLVTHYEVVKDYMQD